MKNNDKSVLTDKKELSFLVSELMEKEKEYELRIKGLEQILVDENKKTSQYEKEVQNLKKEINKIQININNSTKENQISLGKIQNEIDYANGTNKIDEYNYNYKISIEENKQKKYKKDIKVLDNEIRDLIIQIQAKESLQNINSNEINKLNEEMIKFLSNLDS